MYAENESNQQMGAIAIIVRLDTMLCPQQIYHDQSLVVVDVILNSP